MSETILEIKDLHTSFPTDSGEVRAVNGINFRLDKGKVLGIVGESGSGKSVTAYSILRILDNPGRITQGEVLFHGENVVDYDKEKLRAFRGAKVSIIFQDPMTSLNPVYTVENQLVEAIRLHTSRDAGQARERALEMLQLVGVNEPQKRLKQYPHQLSGGMRQRVMIAMALALDPELLIADEPSTALDVTIQAQILDLMRALVDKFNTSVILITHNLGVIAEMADRVAVMYAGQIVETTDIKSLFDDPLHPYTQGLIGSIPVLGKIKDRLDVIPGTVPELVNLPPGCRFAPRCRAREQYNLDICCDIDPDLEEGKSEHYVRCWLYRDHNGHKAPLSAV